MNWAYFPRSAKPTGLAIKVVEAFQLHYAAIDSASHTSNSNFVLSVVAPNLESIGFRVESGKKKSEKIYVPVLYGNNGRVSKAFEADAYHEEEGFVIEVEAGRATINNQFLKDLFQACMMDGVEYLCIAVRKIYVAAGIKNPDFERVVTFFEALYASNRFSLPLKGILVIGY